MFVAGTAFAHTRTLVARSVGLRVRYAAAVQASEAARKRSVILCAHAQDLSEFGRLRREPDEPPAPESVGPSNHAGFCNGTVVIHKDLTVTCTEANCASARAERRQVVARHNWFTACADTLGSLCPRCNANVEWPPRRVGDSDSWSGLNLDVGGKPAHLDG